MADASAPPTKALPPPKTLDEVSRRISAGDFNPKILRTSKRVRGRVGGSFLFDTKEARLVWEDGKHPNYWIPRHDFVDTVANSISIGRDGFLCPIRFSPKEWSNPVILDALFVPESTESPLAGLVRIKFHQVGVWYEENAVLRFGPRDPYHRVDVIPTGRHIRVQKDGFVIADTGREGGVMSVWETDMPPRWYIPTASVRADFMRLTATRTRCPYKGEARTYDVVIGGELYHGAAWDYMDPIPECANIATMICFQPSKVEVLVDGIQQLD